MELGISKRVSAKIFPGTRRFGRDAIADDARNVATLPTKVGPGSTTKLGKDLAIGCSPCATEQAWQAPRSLRSRYLRASPLLVSPSLKL
jgi:hypothetical protein